MTRALLVVALAWVLFPLWWAVAFSLKRPADFFTAKTIPFLQFEPTLAHWRDEWHAFFGQSGFARGLGNSLLVGLATATLSLCLGLLAALGLLYVRRARFSIWLLLLLFLLPRAVPPVVIALPFARLMQHAGLDDTLLALVIAHTTLALPLAILLLHSGLSELPPELFEAAQLDGHTWLGILWSIAIPLMRPVLLAAGTLCFALSWSEFLFAVTNNAQHAVTVPVTVAFLLGKDGPEFEYVGSHLVIVLLPPLLISFLARRYVVRGLSFGAVRD